MTGSIDRAASTAASQAPLGFKDSARDKAPGGSARNATFGLRECISCRSHPSLRWRGHYRANTQLFGHLFVTRQGVKTESEKKKKSGVDGCEKQSFRCLQETSAGIIIYSAANGCYFLILIVGGVKAPPSSEARIHPAKVSSRSQIKSYFRILTEGCVFGLRLS